MKKLLFLIIALPAVYLASYFLLMEEGTALDPESKLPAYKSVSKLAEGLRVDGPITVRIAEAHWSNPMFEPLDRIFR